MQDHATIMKVTRFESREQWLEARKGKITGTRLKDIVVKRGTGKKIGYYELIAERLSVSEEEFDGFVPNETPMDRGTRLQKWAVAKFSQATGKNVCEDTVIWSREDNENIAISPDGVIKDKDGLPTETEAIEIKCLASSRHIEAFLTNQVPDEYEFQKLQYFIVNEKLETLYFAFFDPRIPCKDFFYLEIKRADVQADIDTYLEYQRKTLVEIEQIVAELQNF